MHTIFQVQNKCSISLSTGHFFIVKKYTLLFNANVWLLAFLLNVSGGWLSVLGDLNGISMDWVWWRVSRTGCKRGRMLRQTSSPWGCHSAWQWCIVLNIIDPSGDSFTAGLSFHGGGFLIGITDNMRIEEEHGQIQGKHGCWQWWETWTYFGTCGLMASAVVRHFVITLVDWRSD